MKILISLLTIAFTAVGCSTIEVSHRHDNSEDFTRFLGYAWMPESKASGTIPIDEPTVNRRIKKAVDEQLQYQGYRKTTLEEADFLVGFQVAINSKLSSNDVATNYDFNKSQTDPKLIGTVQTDSSARPLTYIRTYEQGSLILNIADAKTKELVWWSSAQAEVNVQDSTEVRKKRITKAVKKMLKDFPPQ